MRDIIHEWWPVAAVTLFTLFLVVQIPRKAIFPPTPDVEVVVPYASFITLSTNDYAEAKQNAGPSWKLRESAQLGDENAFDFDEPLPPPRTLPVGAAFAAPYRPPRAAPPAPAPLLPPTLATSGVEGLAEAAASAAAPLDEELLVLPDSLKEK